MDAEELPRGTWSEDVHAALDGLLRSPPSADPIAVFDWDDTVIQGDVSLALLRRMPSAIPIAAATPIAGAPRITMVLIAFATSAAVLHDTYSSAAGSLR